jgi:hypothetical protein
VNREAVPQIMQARDLSPAWSATNARDPPQGVECCLNGAAGERRSVSVGQKEGMIALGEAAASAQGHIDFEHRCKLQPDRDQAALVELRGANDENCFLQIDIREGKARRLTEAQAGSVQQDKQSPECDRVQLGGAAPADRDGRRIEKPL